MRRTSTTLTALVLLLGCAHKPTVSPPSPSPRIAEVQRIEEELGYAPSDAFLRRASEDDAPLCYWTEKLKLPDSYEGLRLRRASEQGCRVDENRYDLFRYEPEAVARPRPVISPRLEQASEQRLRVVVAHEDFHRQKEARSLPTDFEEAAATLAGFLVAAESAPNLPEETRRFLEKAERINDAHRRLSSSYAERRRRNLSRPEALAAKRQVFEEIRRACEASKEKPQTFDPCPSADNNAGLAFDHSYTKRYPLLFELYLATGQDAAATIALLLRPRPASARTSRGAEKWFQRLLREQRAAAAKPSPDEAAPQARPAR